MSQMTRMKHAQTIIGRLNHGADLLEELTGICRQHDIRLGRI